MRVGTCVGDRDLRSTIYDLRLRAAMNVDIYVLVIEIYDLRLCSCSMNALLVPPRPLTLTLTPTLTPTLTLNPMNVLLVPPRPQPPPPVSGPLVPESPPFLWLFAPAVTPDSTQPPSRPSVKADT